MQDRTIPRGRFEALDVAIGAVGALRPVVARVRQCDRDLGEQARRALSSVALNLGESRGTYGGHRRERLASAAGSCLEARTALELAVAWGYVDAAAIAEGMGLLDRVSAMLYRLVGAR